MTPQTEEEKVRMSNLSYVSCIGSIMYVMLCTRPDISFGVSVTSKYQSDLGNDHWTAVKHILKYLKGTRDKFLIYGEDELQVKGYTDQDFQGDPDDKKSTLGYIFTFNGGAVS